MRAALLTGPIIPPAAMRVPPIAKGSPVDLWLRVEKRQTLHSPGRSSPGGPDNSIQSLELSGPLSVMKQLHACVHVCMIVDSSQRLVSDPPPPPREGGGGEGLSARDPGRRNPAGRRSGGFKVAATTAFAGPAAAPRAPARPVALLIARSPRSTLGCWAPGSIQPVGTTVGTGSWLLPRLPALEEHPGRLRGQSLSRSNPRIARLLSTFKALVSPAGWVASLKSRGPWPRAKGRLLRGTG